MLTRQRERKRLIEVARGALRFLVLDELHTYRGRQGADVAMLVRRVRDACEVPNLQVVGTSATMASGEAQSLAEQRERVAAVATKLFGADVKPDHVIGETLRRATVDIDLDDPSTAEALRRTVERPQPPDTFDAILADPLSSWLESTLGLDTDPETGWLIRRAPRPIGGPTGVAAELATTAGLSQVACAEAIRRQLLAGYDAQDDDGYPAFAFRLHQFMTAGNEVYATLDDPSERYITLEGQTYKPGDRSRVLLPLAFCRECGQEYYTVTRDAGGRSGRATSATPGRTPSPPGSSASTGSAPGPPPLTTSSTVCPVVSAAPKLRAAADRLSWA